MTRIAFIAGVCLSLAMHGCYRSRRIEIDDGGVVVADADCGDAGPVWVHGIVKMGGELPDCIGPRVIK